MSSASNNHRITIPTAVGLRQLDEMLLHEESDEEEPTQPGISPTATSAAGSTAISASSSDNPGSSSSSVTPSEALKYGPLLSLSIDDVKLSDQADQISIKGVRNVMTYLIRIGDIKAADISAKQLQNWSLREQCGRRDGSKSDLCITIAAFVKEHRRLKERGMDTQAPESIFARTKINFIWAINVLGVESFKVNLIYRGSQIGRAKLDPGIQADEELRKQFAALYNDGNNEDLVQLKYTVDWKGAVPNPTGFTVINWQKAQQAFKDMSAKYDSSHKRWKQSGFHGDFEEIPFDNFATTGWLVYLHKFLEENPGLLEVITSDLDQETFFETGTGMSDDDGNNSTAGDAMTVGTSRRRKRRTAATLSKKKKKSPNDDKDGIFRTFAESSMKNAQAAEAKCSAISYSALSIARQNAEQAMEAASKKKQDAKRGLKTHPFCQGNNSRARKVIKTTKKKIDPPSPDKEDWVFSQSTTDSIRNLGSFDTVQQYAVDYIESEKQIADRKEELAQLKDDMEAHRRK